MQTRVLNQFHSGELQREIDTLIARLERIALTNTTAPSRAINRSFNERDHPEILGEATNQRSRRVCARQQGRAR